MKTGRIIVSLGLLCFFVTTGFANPADTTTKLLDVAVASNPLLKGMDYIPTFTVYNGTLYMVNKGKLLQADLKTGAISVNKPVTGFLKRFPKEPEVVSELRVTANGYYLIVWDQLYHIDTSGAATKVYQNYGALQGLQVADDKLVIVKIDTIALINKNGKLLDKWVFPDRAASTFYRGEKGVYYNSRSMDSVYEFQSGPGAKLVVNIYPPLEECHSIADPWLSYASDKYFFVFDYAKRKAIYVIKKDPAKNTLYKTIGVKGANLTPTHQQVMDEEGTPNLEIGYSDNVYYILSIIKGKLKVLSFTV